jgi:thiamine biosynthesis lipoprotein
MRQEWWPSTAFAWAILLCPCRGAQLRRFEYSADAMGGAFTITLYCAGQKVADRAAAAAFDELERLDRMLSNYRLESEWSRVNRDADREPVKVSTQLFNLLVACVEYSRRSEGAFDISVGPLVRAWGYRNGHGKPTPQNEVDQALAKVGFIHIRLNPENRTVQFARAGMELDPGGIGKGFAVDRMIEVLKRHGIERALVSAAGSSIYGLGAPPGSPGWPVKIGHPKKHDVTVAEVTLKDEALSTSGIREKSFRANGRTYGHILDPRTGRPAEGATLVAVSAPSTTDSEAWTKAVFVNGRDWSAAHTPRGWRVFFCDEEKGCSWLSPKLGTLTIFRSQELLCRQMYRSKIEKW